MKVVLRNPRREVEVAGGRRVSDVLKELAILPETVLVIRGDELLTSDVRLGENDTIELRPVMSGGAPGAASRGCPVDGLARPGHLATGGLPPPDAPPIRAGEQEPAMTARAGDERFRRR